MTRGQFHKHSLLNFRATLFPAEKANDHWLWASMQIRKKNNRPQKSVQHFFSSHLILIEFVKSTPVGTKAQWIKTRKKAENKKDKKKNRQ
jgi:hypothetical protein